MNAEEANTCPACKEPNVHVRHISPDGVRFRRCPECCWSWFLVVKPKTPDTP